jgi:hypothetical protein
MARLTRHNLWWSETGHIAFGAVRSHSFRHI